jgi:hypothetical protein
MRTRVLAIAALALSGCAKEPTATAIVVVPYGYTSTQAFDEAIRAADRVCSAPPGFERDRRMRQFRQEHPTIQTMCRDTVGTVAL